MHPDKVIFRMDRWSDGINKIPDDPNTLTCQSTATYNDRRDPLYGPVSQGR